MRTYEGDAGVAISQDAVPDALFFAGRRHEAYVARYQADFCGPSTGISPNAYDSGAAGAFAHALQAAAAGDLAAARRRARDAFSRSAHFGEALVLMGELDLDGHDPAGARRAWLQAVTTTTYAYPDDQDEGHSGFVLEAIVLLVHDRP